MKACAAVGAWFIPASDKDQTDVLRRDRLAELPLKFATQRGVLPVPRVCRLTIMTLHYGHGVNDGTLTASVSSASGETIRVKPADLPQTLQSRIDSR